MLRGRVRPNNGVMAVSVFDLFKTYEQGVVRRKERDTNGDGKVDFWEYLDEKGNVLKTGKDLDADGVMDVRDE